MLALPFNQAALAKPKAIGAPEAVQCAPKRSQIRGNHRLSDCALEWADTASVCTPYR